VHAGWAPRDVARAHLRGGVRLLQLRAKTLESGPFLDLALAIGDDARAAGAHFIVNDRADVAVLCGATGVHVGQDDLSPADVRLVAGPDVLVGLSTHTEAQVEQALLEPVGYIAIGPVFGTSTKATPYTSLGLGAVRHAADRGASVGMPVVAIGGITLETAASVLAAGAASVAVISDLVTDDPEARVRAYLQRLAG